MQLLDRKNRPTNRRSGATLIDVAAGSMLMAILLIPSMNLMSESNDNAHRLKVRQALLDQAEFVMEITKFTHSNSTTFARSHANGLTQFRTVQTSLGTTALGRVQVIPDPSVSPAQLVTIQVDVWFDDNRDRQPNGQESSASLRTQWAAP